MPEDVARTPVAFIQLFFSPKTLELISKNANANAEAKQIKELTNPPDAPKGRTRTWRPTSPDEISVILEILLLMRLKFHGRSKDTMKMDVKLAGRGFKIYSLCFKRYVWNFMWTSQWKKKGPIGLKANAFFEKIVNTLKLSPSERVALQMALTLPHPERHTVYMDNFFISTKLLEALRTYNLAAVGTVKAGSGYSPCLLRLREMLKKEKNWGLQTAQRVGNVLCVSWMDNNNVQLL